MAAQCCSGRSALRATPDTWTLCLLLCEVATGQGGCSGRELRWAAWSSVTMTRHRLWGHLLWPLFPSLVPGTQAHDLCRVPPSSPALLCRVTLAARC